MILTLVALISLFSLWAWAARGTYRRSWKGIEARHFEREWEIKGDKDRVYFSIPSFKSAYFEMRPANFWSRFLSQFPAFAPTLIDRRFRFLTEEPHLARVLSGKIEALDALMSLEDYADYQILSTGSELHGWLKFKGKATEAPLDRAEFQRALHALAPLLEVQFDLPLNEMKPGEVMGWRRSQALPIAMTGSALVVWLLHEILLPQDLIFQPSSSKLWLGLSLFATGLGLFWGAIRVPPHYFLRTALAFIGLFSWSSFLWIYGVFTALNPVLAQSTLSLQCQLRPGVHGVFQSHHECQLIDQERVVKVPAHFIRTEWIAGAPQLEIEGHAGFFGQIFASKVSLASSQPAKEITPLDEGQVREGAPPSANGENLTNTTSDESRVGADSEANVDMSAVEAEESTAPKAGSMDVDEHLGLDLGSEAGLPPSHEE